MSEGDWDTVTKIGTKVRGPGANTEKEKVIRSESALNAARRQGADISTEKKYGGANSVSPCLFIKDSLTVAFCVSNSAVQSASDARAITPLTFTTPSHFSIAVTSPTY